MTPDLALEYYQTGWYSQASANFERAWKLLHGATLPNARPLSVL